MAAEDDVRKASEKFYDALNGVINGDPSRMEAAWWHDPDVTTGHPMGTWVLGWDSIWITWMEFARTIQDGKISVSDLHVRVFGDFAYTAGTEDASLTIMGKHVAFKGQATNIFRRKDGEWRLIHHHADKAPSFEQAV